MKVQNVFKVIKQLEKDHNRTRDPFFTHPPKLQACKDNLRIGTEKAYRLGEFNDMLVGARPPKVQKARILTCKMKRKQIGKKRGGGGVSSREQ